MADKRLTFGLSANIIQDMCNVFSQYKEIDRVLIFGSRAKNTWKDGSDVDLAVIAPTMTNENFTQLWSKIDELPVIFKIDCLHWDRLSKPELKKKILAEGIIFYQKKVKA